VARGAGPTAVLNESYRVFARECGFEVDPCRPATGSDKGKAERSVRTFRDCFGDLFRREWPALESLQAALDERATSLMRRLKCPITGTSVEEALEAERRVLQPLPRMGEPFDVVVARPVSRDAPVSFEGRRSGVVVAVPELEGSFEELGGTVFVDDLARSDAAPSFELLQAIARSSELFLKRFAVDADLAAVG